MNTNLQIQKLTPADADTFGELIAVFNSVFETDLPSVADLTYLQKLLANPGFVAIVIMNGTEVIGGITAYEMQLYYGAYSEMYIYDLAVNAQYQRMGLGRMLITALEDHCKDKGITTMFVEAHEEDTHAIDFYRSTGASAEKVVHFNYELPSKQG